MDEELTGKTTEVEIETSVSEEVTQEAKVVLERVHTTVSEAEDIANVSEPKIIEVTVEEGEGYVAGKSGLHSTLIDRNDPNQHVIESITGLREELNWIENPRTIESNGTNAANYYEWADATYDEYGYFVSLVPGTSTIQICDGADIFGVSVDNAGFVGGQDVNVPRDNSYGLIATSGLVDVRCELDVEVGDYVVCNAQGYAKKTESNYGYRVLAKENKNGVEYAVIALGVQSDITDSLGREVNVLDTRLDAAESNIISAINLANEAYKKSQEAATSSSVSGEAVKEALDNILKSEEKIEEFEQIVGSASATSAQAKAIAENAATSAASMKNEAVESANNAAAQVGELTKTLEPLTTWTDPETGNKGASYLADYISNGLATKAEIEAAEDDLKHAKSAILKNAKSLQSLVISIDKYSVGEHSTAYGLTLKEATSILESDIIYVPTVNKTGDDKEVYNYTDAEGNQQTYSREFLKGYLYRWGELPDGLYGWITVDRDYSKDKLNTSAPAVYFSPTEPDVIGDFGYWYTDSKTVADGYEPYTLYKWEENQWIAVATLAGNSQNRSISQVRQTATSIESSVTNIMGDVTYSKNWIDDNSTNIQNVVTWKEDNAEAIATTIQRASDSEAYIAQVASVKNADGTVNAAASIVTAVNESGSSVVIDADHINFTAEDFTIDANHINFEADDFTIDAKHIINLEAPEIDLSGYVTFTGLSEGTTTIDGACIKTGAIESSNYVKDKTGSQLSLVDGSFDSKHFKVSNTGEITANSGKIGGWDIDTTKISKGDVGLYADSYYKRDSLVNSGKKSIVRFYGGDIIYSEDKFVVLDDGSLYAQAAKLGDGTLGSDNSIFLSTTNMSGVSGFFDGATITNWRMTVGENFGVTSDGSLYASSVKLGTGTLGSGESIFLSTTDMSGTLGSSTSGLNVQQTNWRMTVGENFGVTSDGSLYAGSGYIGPWQISANGIKTNLKESDGSIYGTVKLGEFGVEIDDNYSEVGVGSQGMYFYARNGSDMSYAGRLGVNDLQYGDGYPRKLVLYAAFQGRLVGTWMADNDLSDERIKNTVEIMPEAYDMLFDHLQPKRYKYNHGTSDRFHTGYVAQDVVKAIESAGLTTQDFAGIMLSDPGTEQERWYLRRDEFVALNTWQIQKLKSRVTELEATVADLKAKLD